MVNVEHKCLECGKIIKPHRKFCPKPAYCQHLFGHKNRNPKLAKVLDIKDNNFYYFIGLICTDGNIFTYDRNAINITLNIKDRELLESIQDLYGGYLYDKKDNTTIWSASFKPLRDFLTDVVGITVHKSLTLNVESFFTSLTHDNKIAFIRGVLDGDGGVRIYKVANPKYPTKIRESLSFEICSGSKQFLQMIAKFINDNVKDVNLKIKYEKQARANYIKSYAKFPPLRILDFIYSNVKNNIRMERKYNNYVYYNKTYGTPTNDTPKRTKESYHKSPQYYFKKGLKPC